jgi:SAM-dependent methyltransferase
VSVDVLDVSPTPPNFVRASASDLPFADSSFTTALLFEVLEHIDQPDRALCEVRRIANRLVMSVPNCKSYAILPLTGLTLHHYTDPTHVNFFDDVSLIELLESCGWNVREIRHINPVSPGTLMFYGWGIPLSVLRVLAPLLKRIPRPRPLTMSIVAVADAAS